MSRLNCVPIAEKLLSHVNSIVYIYITQTHSYSHTHSYSYKNIICSPMFSEFVMYIGGEVDNLAWDEDVFVFQHFILGHHFVFVLVHEGDEIPWFHERLHRIPWVQIRLQVNQWIVRDKSFLTGLGGSEVFDDLSTENNCPPQMLVICLEDPPHVLLLFVMIQPWKKKHLQKQCIFS